MFIQGFSPSQAQIASLQDTTKDVVTLSQFEDFCSAATHLGDAAAEMASAFALWDPAGVGYITKSQLKHILMNFGEDLNPHEAQYAADVIAGPGDKVNYLQFCQRYKL